MARRVLRSLLIVLLTGVVLGACAPAAAPAPAPGATFTWEGEIGHPTIHYDAAAASRRGPPRITLPWTP